MGRDLVWGLGLGWDLVLALLWTTLVKPSSARRLDASSSSISTVGFWSSKGPNSSIVG
jgi:hypothetical protein